MDTSCMTCKFCALAQRPSNTGEFYECRVNPPSTESSLFPIVNSTLWCGKYEPKREENIEQKLSLIQQREANANMKVEVLTSLIAQVMDLLTKGEEGTALSYLMDGWTNYKTMFPN